MTDYHQGCRGLDPIAPREKNRWRSIRNMVLSYLLWFILAYIAIRTHHEVIFLILFVVVGLIHNRIKYNSWTGVK